MTLFQTQPILRICEPTFITLFLARFETDYAMFCGLFISFAPHILDFSGPFIVIFTVFFFGGSTTLYEVVPILTGGSEDLWCDEHVNLFFLTYKARFDVFADCQFWFSNKPASIHEGSVEITMLAFFILKIFHNLVDFSLNLIFRNSQ